MAHQVVPMLCIPKKNGKLHTVFNLQEQNDNTVKDVTLFPGQDIIHNDMARAAYRSKLNMSEAYDKYALYWNTSIRWGVCHSTWHVQEPSNADG